MPLLCVGIEASGKSFSVIAVADETGQIQAAERYPTRLNFYESSKSELGAEIYRLLKGILSGCGLSVTDFCKRGGKICAGITGVTTRYDREVGMQDVWRAAGLSELNPLTTGGIEISFTGAARSLRGAAITAHVGSAALARTETSIWRVGGWGPLIGDEGSAYWIGRKALNALCRLRDERIGYTSELSVNIKHELDSIAIWRDIIADHSQLSEQWIDALILLMQRTRETREFRYIVSDVAKAVFKTAKEHPDDQIAKDIVETAALELVDQLRVAVERAGLTKSGPTLPLVLRGGLFKYHKPFCELVKLKVRELFPHFEVLDPTNSNAMRPVLGALMFALSGSKFCLPDEKVILNLEQSATSYTALDND